MTEEEVYQKVANYINGKSHKCPCMLATIKKNLRTPTVVNLIFSNPRIFDLKTEFRQVPPESYTDEFLIKALAYNLEFFVFIPEEFRSPAVLIACVYFGKLNMNYLIKKTDDMIKYNKEIDEICDELKKVIKPSDSLEDVIKLIIAYSKKLEVNSNKEEQKQRESQYNSIDFGDKKILIRISGNEGNGKKKIASLLSSKIKKSKIIAGYNRRDLDLSECSKGNNVIIFCDRIARYFCPSDENDKDREFIVIDVLVKAGDLERKYRLSPLNTRMTYKSFVEREAYYNSYECDGAYDIVVRNHFDDSIILRVDEVLELVAREAKVDIEQYRKASVPADGEKPLVPLLKNDTKN